jgi:mono/diheme cytochrome c family protein
MNYPVWYLPEIGGGFLIALIAVLHVFVSHFAVGGGLYLIYSEKKGLRENSQPILDFTKRHARFFLLITMVFGSITGVGIWFIIALVNPAATSWLIHTFVFGWAAEWVFFTVEITAAFVYFYTFGKMESRTHLLVGWVYFIAAWMSLFLINGIICFMLTPGAWLQNQNFWIGFFNPSFLPSLFFRTFIAIMLAGVYGYLSASFTRDQAVRFAMTRFSGKWALVALAGAVPSALWYVQSLPEPARELVLGKSPTITAAINWGLAGTVILLAITLAAGIARPAWNIKPVALLSMLCALITMGSFEWIREAARRPYAINEIMYSNMIMKDEAAEISEKGFLQAALWVENRDITDGNRLSAGEELFIQQCFACHTLGGFNNDLKAQTAHMSFGALKSYINRIHQVRYFMPPFVGTEQEAEALAAYLVGGVHGKDVVIEVRMVAPGGSEGADLFENHCAACHEVDDLAPSLEGVSTEELAEMLATLDQLSDEMVPFDGDEQEADNLARFLFSLNNETAPPPAPVSGAGVFDNHCGACHSVEEMAEIAAGWEREEFLISLDSLDELSEEMVPFTGTPEEKKVLTGYIYDRAEAN